MPQTIRRPWTPLLLLAVSPLFAEDRMYLDDVTVPGAPDPAVLTLRADNDVPILGFSFGVRYDPAALDLTDVTNAGTDVSDAPFFDGDSDEVSGVIGFGCVLDMESPIDHVLPAGAARSLARLTFAIVGPPDSSTEVRLETVAVYPSPSPPIKNVLTDAAGHSLVPALSHGNVTIEDRSPRIVSVSGNEGIAGDTFTVVGDFFGEPGLQVKVCAVAADAVLGGDGRTLTITAPDCGAPGFAPLEICTVRGCATKADGFRYVVPEVPFVRGRVNADESVDIADGVGILLYLYTGTFETSCPDALDIDDDGTVEMDDSLRIFQYLFLAGAAPQPPYPDAGSDPTPGDLLAPCQ